MSRHRGFVARARYARRHAAPVPRPGARAARAARCAVTVPVLSGALLVGALGVETAAAAPVTGVSPGAAAAPGAIALTTPMTLSYGSRGARVTWVQRTLGVRPVSGWYGPITRRAVKRFQRGHGLRVTGRVDARTWRHLVSAAKKRRTTSVSGSRVLTVAARAARGAHYRYGATGPGAFDCSGYTSYVYRKLGKRLPHSSSAQRSATRRISRSHARRGDLVFAHSSSGRVYHVAIYAGHGSWYEASNPRTGVGRHDAWTSHVTFGRVR